MPARPPLPDDYTLPEDVDEWTHDPESGKNAHVWTSHREDVSVGVFDTLGNVRVNVFDDRVHGFGNHVELWDREIDDDHLHTDRHAEIVADATDFAIDWLGRTAPAEWSHGDVREAVFDPPPKYELEYYFLESRDTTIYYHLEGADEASPLREDEPDAEPTPETYPYLRIHVWNGSGNAEVALAPWVRAHDHQCHEVVDVPEECGVEVAVRETREWAADYFGVDVQSETGQTGLGAYAGRPE